MSRTLEEYLEGLKNAYLKHNGKESWGYFEKNIQGAKKNHIDELTQIFPDTPKTLIDFLKYVDGTYWRKYADETISFFVLGSDVSEYPYYLLSSEEIIQNKNVVRHYSEYIERAYECVEIDDKIINKADSNTRWLHFSDCMNNGGTSQLFIDFSPSSTGKKGQIIRFLHDPDELKVIADSFDDFLKKLMDDGYSFINENTIE
nr:SMI1/KNR4 family protein [Tenacibaculum mesophilum]